MGHECPIMSRDVLIMFIINVFSKEIVLPHMGPNIDDTRDEPVRIFSFSEKVSCG
jgi:hypothetical protein